MKIRPLFIIRAVLCAAAIIALCPQAPNAGTAHASVIPLISKSRVILCGPGLVYRCNQFGCFCVKP